MSTRTFNADYRRGIRNQQRARKQRLGREIDLIDAARMALIFLDVEKNIVGYGYHIADKLRAALAARGEA